MQIMKFKSVNPEYTGGNIYVFTGEVDDVYFMADTSFYDVRLLDANPLEHEDEERFGFPEWQCADWQEEHLVRDLEPHEAVEFLKEMLAWVIENKPSGNYAMDDMEWFAADVATLEGDDWR